MKKKHNLKEFALGILECNIIGDATYPYFCYYCGADICGRCEGGYENFIFDASTDVKYKVHWVDTFLELLNVGAEV